MSGAKHDRVPQGYCCGACETFRRVAVDPDDADRTIRYYCPDCNDFTEHEPNGSPDWFA